MASLTKYVSFIGAFRFSGVPKNELLLKARILLGDFKPERRFESLFDEPVTEFKFPELKRDVFEDAFDEIEILRFPVSCTPFYLLQTKYRGTVMAKRSGESS